MRLLLTFAIALLTLASCSDVYKLKRANKKLVRLVEKHPDLVNTDTTFIQDTVSIDRVERDTTFLNTVTRDTMVIKNDRLTIKYFNTGDSIYIKGTCDSVFIIREIPVEVRTVSPIKRVKYIPEAYKISAWLLWIIAFALLVYIIFIKRKEITAVFK